MIDPALLLALGLPLLLITVFSLLLLRHPERLPAILQRLSRREAMAWNIGVGLIIGLSALRWLLKR
jgi:hypothetical protein